MTSMLSTPRSFHPLFLAALCAFGFAMQSAPAHAENHATPVASSQNAEPSGVVNVNTATAEELDRLPGVGPTRAQAILELRAKVKRFENLDDLMRVKGIGRASLRKLRPMLTLEGQTTLRAPARSPRAASAPSAANASAASAAK